MLDPFLTDRSASLIASTVITAITEIVGLTEILLHESLPNHLHISYNNSM